MAPNPRRVRDINVKAMQTDLLRVNPKVGTSLSTDSFPLW